MRPSSKAIWLTTLPAMLVPFIAALFYFVILRDTAFAQTLYGCAKGFILCWPLFCCFVIYRSGFPKIALRNPRHFKALPAGVIVGLLVALVLLLMMLSPLGEIVRQSTGAIRSQAVALGFLEHYLALTVFLALFHSLLEEYYWRWFVYGNLRQVLPALAANLLAAVSFAAHHIILAIVFFGFPLGVALGSTVAVGGLIWNTMYEKQGTLAGAWVSHMIVDLAIMGTGGVLLFTSG